MSFEFQKTEIEGLILIKPHQYLDNRGAYRKWYEKDIFVTNGISYIFSESSDILSCKGALRGLHYQTEKPQAKLLHVIKGSIFDVALDLRRDSKTFGKVHSEILSEKEQRAILVPEGFAHGFISLEDNTIFSYQCSGKYISSACGGILWNSPELEIPWPLGSYDIQEIIATEKDQNWPTFSEYVAQNY